MDLNQKRSEIKVGYIVEIVQKHHQKTGELTEGEVKRLLTKSSHHPHGIKVQLTTGEVGRVKHIIEHIYMWVGQCIGDDFARVGVGGGN